MNRDEFDPVMLALGNAVFAAQAFEMNLGTTLIALTVIKGDKSMFPNEEAVRNWLDKVDRLTIGQLKQQLKDTGLLPDQMVEEIGEINRMRIEVAHHFSNRWVEQLEEEDGRKRAIDELQAYETVFLSAATKLQTGIENLKDIELLG